jgi:hypothetical protein
MSFNEFLEWTGVGILVLALIAVVFWILQLMWNYALPGLFGMPEIKYWQLVCLFILVKTFLSFNIKLSKN